MSHHVPCRSIGCVRRPFHRLLHMPSYCHQFSSWIQSSLLLQQYRRDVCRTLLTGSHPSSGSTYYVMRSSVHQILYRHADASFVMRVHMYAHPYLRCMIGGGDASYPVQDTRCSFGYPSLCSVHWQEDSHLRPSHGPNVFVTAPQWS